MKFCTKCGAELNDDAKFCNKCGNSQINDGGSPQSSTDAASERNENVYGLNRRARTEKANSTRLTPCAKP